jgi:hypothetical protein
MARGNREMLQRLITICREAKKCVSYRKPGKPGTKTRDSHLISLFFSRRIACDHIETRGQTQRYTGFREPGTDTTLPSSSSFACGRLVTLLQKDNLDILSASCPP